MHYRKAFTANRLEAASVVLLRVVLGVVFVVHGAMKLADVESTAHSFALVYDVPLPQLAVYLAIAGEFLGGLGLLMGLMTRLAAGSAAVTMVFAIAFVHAGRGLLSRNGGWEFPLTLLCASLFFVAHGGGALSVDRLWRRLRGQRKHAVIEEPMR